MRGSTRADVLIGDAGDNVILGMGGGDAIEGRDGDDVLTGKEVPTPSTEAAGRYPRPLRDRRELRALSPRP